MIMLVHELYSFVKIHYDENPIKIKITKSRYNLTSIGIQLKFGMSSIGFL